MLDEWRPFLEDLRRGQFRRASSDQDLIQIIRNGIPGTVMPANGAPLRSRTVPAKRDCVAVSWRSIPVAAPSTGSGISVAPDGTNLPRGSGTPTQGEAVYRATCQTCHGERGAGKLRRYATCERVRAVALVAAEDLVAPVADGVHPRRRKSRR